MFSFPVELFILLLYAPAASLLLVSGTPFRSLAFLQSLLAFLVSAHLILQAANQDFYPCWITLWMAGWVFQLWLWTKSCRALLISSKYWQEWWKFMCLEAMESEMLSHSFTETKESIPTFIQSSEGKHSRMYLTITADGRRTPARRPPLLPAQPEEASVSSLHRTDTLFVHPMVYSEEQRLTSLPELYVPALYYTTLPRAFRLYLKYPKYFSSFGIKLLLVVLGLISAVVTVIGQYALGTDYHFQDVPPIDIFTFYACRPQFEFYFIFTAMFVLLAPILFMVVSTLWYFADGHFMRLELLVSTTGTVVVTLIGTIGQALGWWRSWHWMVAALLFSEWVLLLFSWWDAWCRRTRSKDWTLFQHRLQTDSEFRRALEFCAMRDFQLSAMHFYLHLQQLPLDPTAEELDVLFRFFLAPTAAFYVPVSQEFYEKFCSSLSGEAKWVREELIRELEAFLFTRLWGRWESKFIK